MKDCIAGLGRGHVVSRGADATDPGGYSGHLLHWPALAELLKAAKLGHLKIGIATLPSSWRKIS